MKQEFSTSWNSSVQPRKQRKFRHNAPLHIRSKFLSAHLSDTLQAKHNRKSATVRKGDEVVVMRGAFKKKTAKISRVDTRRSRIYLEAITVTKKDGTKVEVPIQPSNVQLISLVEDKMRFTTANPQPKENPEVKRVAERKVETNAEKKTEKTQKVTPKKVGEKK